jgi:hypothetical protein
MSVKKEVCFKKMHGYPELCEDFNEDFDECLQCYTRMMNDSKMDMNKKEYIPMGEQHE